MTLPPSGYHAREVTFGCMAKGKGVSSQASVLISMKVLVGVNVYAIIIVLCISIDKSNIRTRSLRNTHSQETQHLSWETL
jgi:hypothetical protein